MKSFLLAHQLNAIAMINPVAQYLLGYMYVFGSHAPRNYNMAYIWFSLANANGIEQAKELRDVASKKLSYSELSKAQEQVKVLWEYQCELD